MKQLFFGALRHLQPFALFFSSVLFIGFIMTGGKKEISNAEAATEEIQSKSSSEKGSNGFGNYTGLDLQTVSELQQAKIATAKYNDFGQAIADGYVDINVIVPEMGYHF